MAYVNSVVQEAEDRMLNQVRPVEDYFRLRRDTAATPTTIGLQEIGLDLPNEVYFHPVLASLTQDAEDMLIVINVSPFQRLKQSECVLLPCVGHALVHSGILLWVRLSQPYHDHHGRA